MKTDELREMYLSFFETKGCMRRPSDVLVPKDDPTVLFTPAGMNQFKNEFLGIGKLEFTRATTCQKCLRTGDISNVGVTAYHHTFFEMLGNFSFGDYFKKEAIHWAWEFLTSEKWLGLDGDKLTVSVFHDDDEAYNIWHDEIHLPDSRIRRDDEHENFWPAGAPSNGPDGVCGPCSEIFYSHDGKSENEVEIWNLVFTQFNRVGDPPDNLRPLPKKNIDTGMGLERTVAVLQGVESNFQIDSLLPLCQAAGEAVDTKYEFAAASGRALRRIADHVRAITFCIHEGISPGNEKEQYVVRQLLRRASLEGYLLGQRDSFLHELVPTVVSLMATAYPDIKADVSTTADAIREEESQFLSVIDRGLTRFDSFLADAKKSGAKTISGKAAFDLHQTDGFLIELTQALATHNGLAVDMAEFAQCMENHKRESGSGAFQDAVMIEGPVDSIRKHVGDTEFLGYVDVESPATVMGLIDGQEIVESAAADTAARLVVVLDKTPFYGEAGGQVGDSGVLTNDTCRFRVSDTQRNQGLILHLGELESGTLSVGDSLVAEVAADRRAGIRRAHSATHLLHAALHDTLGTTAVQRGSKVESDALRFDFSHGRAVTQDQLEQIEDRINSRIAEAHPVTTALMPLEEARAAGAMALFGEKYPDEVRVVTMGEFSLELCGGTHLDNTGQTGLCKVINEEPVAKGIRRITALTGPRALARVRETESLISELTGLLKTPAAELPARVASLVDEVRESKRQLSEQSSQSLADAVDQLLANADAVGDSRIVTYESPVGDRNALRDFVDQVRRKAKSAAVLVGSSADGKVALTAAVSKDLVERGLNAVECVRHAGKLIRGGGGGRPDLAEAGGKLPEKLTEALAAGAAYFREKLDG